MSQIKLNIGCGKDIKQGWINIDISKEISVDISLDIRKDMIPFEDNYADEIYISGVLEQIGDNDQFIHAMNECYRVLKPGKTMTVIVPNAKYAIAHQDPMDVRKFTEATFDYFLMGSNKYNLYGSVYGFKGWSRINISENDRHIFIVTMTK